MTTNNHPAHGPVSLDRLHQISEILRKASAQSDGGNLGYAMADAVKVIDWAIAVFGAEPVGYFYADKPGDWYQISDGDRVPEHRRIPIYSNPQSGTVVKMPNEFISSEGIVVQIEKLMAVLAVHGIQYERKGNARLVASLAGNFRETPDSSTSNCREISETSTNEHEIETHTLLKRIEGMEVSVDVSTCDADAGHRYFGTVTEISELETAKNGFILLVQDAKPNFKQAGNYPVTPDGYVLVPIVPTEDMIINGFESVPNPHFSDEKEWEEYEALSGCRQAARRAELCWAAMIKAAPKQEVKSALEHGMQRYAGAMQKLSEGDK